LIDLFRTPTVRWALFLTVFLHLSQQLCGMDAVFFYSTIILQTAGYDKQTSEYINLGVGGALLVVTIISVFLMDYVGRRILHLVGLGGMFVMSLLLVISLIVESTDAWTNISLVTIILFVSFFSIGPGSIPWLVTAELFNQTYRVPASSIAAFANWSANFSVILAFKPLFTVNVKTHFFCFSQMLFILGSFG
jgi:SP family facilitated glucose transporter-like MFS transporter 1